MKTGRAAGHGTAVVVWRLLLDVKMSGKSRKAHGKIATKRKWMSHSESDVGRGFTWIIYSTATKSSKQKSSDKEFVPEPSPPPPLTVFRLSYSMEIAR
jgi:hypothetical protein